MDDHALAADGLTRGFDHGLAVEGLTFALPRGAVLALLGQNGAGKTTTIRLLNGVLAPDAGSAQVLGLNPAIDGTALRRRTGVLTENAGLDDRLTARENLLVTAQLRGRSGRDIERRCDELLERFDMGREANQRCQGFSTGQRRRVALARALLHDPELLFLDEPTSGLDPAGTRAVMDLIAQLARDGGRTIVLCTHFLDEAAAAADWMAVMHHGRLELFGRPDELARAWWPDIEVTIELGGPVSDSTRAVARSVRGVTRVGEAPCALTLGIESRDVIPVLVTALAAAGIAVFGVGSRRPDLQDVYFAVQDRLNGAPTVGPSALPPTETAAAGSTVTAPPRVERGRAPSAAAPMSAQHTAGVGE